MEKSLLIFFAILIGSLSFVASAEPVEISEVVQAEDNHLTLQQIIDLVYADLDQFWGAQFAAEGLAYFSPHEFRSYTNNNQTPCGAIAPNNAVYCTWTQDGLRYHGIYFDTIFLQRVLTNNGDFGVVAIFAHEWGHLVQNLLGVFIGTQTILKELQADCLTGVYSNSAQNRGIMDRQDLEEALTILYKMGDDLPLLHPDAHGSSDMRSNAFASGFLKGFPGCSFESINQLIEDGTQTPQPVPTPPTSNGSSLRSLDQNGDCLLSDLEFFGGVDRWVSQGISDETFFAAVDAWIGQSSICLALGLDSNSRAPISITQHGEKLRIKSQSAFIINISVEVFNNAGERVITQSGSGTSLRLDLKFRANQPLANGVYFVRIVTRDNDGNVISNTFTKIALLR